MRVKPCYLVVLVLLMMTLLTLLSGGVIDMFKTSPLVTFSATKDRGEHDAAWRPLRKNSTYSLSDIRHLQQNRIRQLRSVCKQLNLDNAVFSVENISFLDLSRIFVDDKHRLLYCEVPKVACTNWKRILLILTGKMNTTEPERLKSGLVHTTYQAKYLRTLNQYKPEDILFRINNYYKFMFVREPLERIVSAYRNKFMNHFNKPYPLRFGRKIIRRFRKNATKHSLEYGDDVKFTEFVKYLLHLKVNDVFDAHWKPFHQLCHPCKLHYDFIGKYETLKEDVNFILEQLGVKNSINFPEKPARNAPKTADIMKTTFANISSEEVHKLWRLYSVDYLLFDYPYPYLRKR